MVVKGVCILPSTPLCQLFDGCNLNPPQEALLLKNVPLVLPAYTLPALSATAPPQSRGGPFIAPRGLDNVAPTSLPPSLSLYFYLHLFCDCQLNLAEIECIT